MFDHDVEYDVIFDFHDPTHSIITDMIAFMNSCRTDDDQMIELIFLDFKLAGRNISVPIEKIIR